MSEIQPENPSGEAGPGASNYLLHVNPGNAAIAAASRPTWRLDQATDEASWTIIDNTTCRGALTSGAGYPR